MRVLAVNDISCVGKCSLSVSLPILSACGVTCDVLPTAILSTHTGGFSGYTFRDLTGDIPAILKHWESLGIRFDFLYSGYLGSIEQIELVENLKRNFLRDGGKFIVDPVMGDNGALYAGFTPQFVEKMRELCKQADFILPNATEACYLANIPYPTDDAYALTEALLKVCPRPIVTGFLENGKNCVYYADDNGIRKYANENVDGFFCGAGDIFASAFTGALARGKSETDSIRLATDFVTASIRRSAIEVPDKRYGLNFEKELFAFLQKLNA